MHVIVLSGMHDEFVNQLYNLMISELFQTYEQSQGIHNSEAVVYLRLHLGHSLELCLMMRKHDEKA